MIKLTIFTPTYNRAYILPELYESLRKQTCKMFEWLIVDDGSSDNTEEIALKWQNESNDFPVRYYKKENGGKCSAINYGLDLAQGELFVVIDSDDTVTADAVQKIIDLEATITEKDKFCAVAFNLGLTEKSTPNRIFDEAYKDATLLERYTDFDGERAFVFYTEIHKKYKYPVFSGEKFITEAVVWNRMADDGYLVRFSNDIICVYEYRDDGLTKAGNSIFINNPHGYGLWLKEKDVYLNKSFTEKLRTYYSFICEIQNKYNDKIIAECIDVPVFLVKILKLINKLISIIRK